MFTGHCEGLVVIFVDVRGLVGALERTGNVCGRLTVDIIL